MKTGDKDFIYAPGKQGCGVVSGSLRGYVFRLNEKPECHQHCDCCMDTICPCPEHHPDYTVGYETQIVEDSDSWSFWLCPDCYKWLSEEGELD